MKIQDKKLIHLPVFTKSGKELGRVCGFEIDVETQAIVNYRVKSHRLIAELFASELIIAAAQVISITGKRMTVKDLELSEKAEMLEKNQLVKNKVAPPVSFSKSE
ncbi:MAG: hypothetical protein COY66_02565 [Candidatus Kerfeldbacteria bacterium CG_4_10_14_0_8_um_filter_42_10]|uniref:PRC-barrel domain-containing protein n=1 Tax=Candidatus Kerfeldbacteria bacterium CG_4_10_14_0_8_um_filter_42_10 TaxID=2014248 RepID=A0A2M7RJG1_9BACT|nr:MAG: hypothetical protein COY66_02565 [Candidatus Kerfeldbacteria bacterium CG_4_10_14_0_8_um_filter_42_10]